MANDVEKYLKILYPNLEGIDNIQYEKDKTFLETYLSEFEVICQKYLEFIDNVPESVFYKDILEMSKDKYDPETKIVGFARAMLEVLETNDMFVQKFDVLMSTVNNESLKKFEDINSEKDTIPITIDSVYELTEEFLEKIDPDGELLDEFGWLVYEDKIELISPEDDSHYSQNEEKIYYKFDGTVNTAHTLVHEFMHHISYKEAQTNMGYHEFTLFREFLSIYYEKAFIEFMNEKGLIPQGEKEALLSERIKSQTKKDPNHCLPMYLELSYKLKEKQNLEKEDILSVTKKYFPDKYDEELWEISSKVLGDFSNEHYFGMEVGAGLTTYMFSTTMAYETKSDIEMLSKMHKLAKYVKDGKSDIETLEHYFETVGETEKEFVDRLGENENKGISVQQIGRKTAKIPGITNIIEVVKKTFAKWNEKAKGEIEH